MRSRFVFGIVGVVVALVLTVLPPGGSVSQAATGTGSISGVVTEEGTGSPAAGVGVWVYDTSYSWVDYVFTASDGSYVVGNLAAGGYKIQFTDNALDPYDTSGPYVDEWYNDKSSFADADVVTVSEGAVTAGVDASLAIGGSIRGAVTAEGTGTPLDNVEVCAISGAVEVCANASAGIYSVDGLPGGYYAVRFRDLTGVYADEWYDDAPTQAGSQTVSVTLGVPTSGIDAALALGGTISGTVTDLGGDPVLGVGVWVYDSSHNLLGSGANLSYDFVTGEYSVSGLPAGSVYVKFDPVPPYAVEWYDDASFYSATPVLVTGGTTTSGVDAVLSRIGRLWGVSRFGTAASVSEAAFPAGSSTVYIANGLNFPDALAGGVAAGLSPGPVLLVGSDSIPAETAAELSRLAPDEIVILGGTAAVSSGVETGLAGFASSVRRLAGLDRFATAVAIAEDAFPAGADVVVLSDGLNYPDALAGVPAAAKLGGPLLLTRSGSLPQVTADEIVALGASRVVILGGTGAVSDAVAGQVAALPGVSTVDRWAGTSRFGTAAAISQQVWPSGANTVYVAYGLNFPDALAGGPAAFLDDGPLLLVRTDSIPAETEAEIGRLAPSRIVILGGAGVVSDTVANQLEALIGP